MRDLLKQTEAQHDEYLKTKVEKIEKLNNPKIVKEHKEKAVKEVEHIVKVHEEKNVDLTSDYAEELKQRGGNGNSSFDISSMGFFSGERISIDKLSTIDKEAIYTIHNMGHLKTTTSPLLGAIRRNEKERIGIDIFAALSECEEKKELSKVNYQGENLSEKSFNRNLAISKLKMKVAYFLSGVLQKVIIVDKKDEDLFEKESLTEEEKRKVLESYVLKMAKDELEKEKKAKEDEKRKSQFRSSGFIPW